MIGRAALTLLQGATLAARVALAVRATTATRHAPPSTDGPLRLLFLSQYPETFAGTKYRLGGWAERLRRAGHTVDLVPAVPSPHAERLAHDWSVGARFEFHRRMLGTRVPAVWRAARYDAALVHMNDLPFWEYGAPFVARALGRLAGRVVLDLDDLPVMGGEPGLRPRAEELIGTVDGLTLGTPDLVDALPRRPSWIVPTCVEPSEWEVPDRSARSDAAPLVLGWVGSPGNLRHLEQIAAPLAAVCRRHGARVRVISSRPPELPGVPVEFVRWTAAGEAADLVPVDIGLAPLGDGPKERRKCGLKALQYMACGMPVVASPVGALSRIVRDRETGAHAETPEAWERVLERLITDRQLRLRQGAAGRVAAADAWSFESYESRFIDALRGVAPDAS